MSKLLNVKYNNTPAYSIMLEDSFHSLAQAVRTLHADERKALIVTDTNIAPLYLDEVHSILEECFSYTDELILIPGEEHKNTDSIAEIYEKLIEDNFDRNDFLIALGGGVIGDMTGFAAATYMRGIRFIQIPTTLLAQVDSSIGGKTGVDFRSYKNMVGAFHMPSLVYSNIKTLLTLDTVQYASGMGEVIKHALIRSRTYFDYLTAHKEDLKQRSVPVLEEVVYQSNIIKKEVVERDPQEKGERQILNYGHTLGHAIEKCSGFSYSHGQCVAFGCLAALFISESAARENHAEICDLMQAAGLSTRLRAMPIDEIILATRKDKKMDHGKVRFILLHDIGNAYIDTNVSDAAMRDALMAVMLPPQI